jgi:hypothetical protein
MFLKPRHETDAVYEDKERGPKRRSWTHVVAIPALKERLKADEA